MDYYISYRCEEDGRLLETKKLFEPTPIRLMYKLNKHIIPHTVFITNKDGAITYTKDYKEGILYFKCDEQMFVYIFNVDYENGILYRTISIPELQVKQEKPPLGIMPKKTWKQIRYQDVAEAIKRYWDTGKKIPIEWIEEYNDFMDDPDIINKEKEN